jgi:MinD-like ATPase involved in chromosome partitioning or flagellar assembly
MIQLAGALVVVTPQDVAQGVTRLVSVPLDPAVARAGDRGKPVFVSEPGGSQAAAYRGLAERLTAAVSAPHGD